MSARTPPRFVPTLTTVLELPAEPVPASEPTPEPASEPAAAAPAAAVVDPGQAVALTPQAMLSEADAFQLEEQLIHRVLQRIDLSLEERLSDTVSAAVQQQLDNMIPRLRGEIETVLRELVSEALAQELSDNTGSTPAFGP
ncbi:hypothetical protein [Variovorax guangxiensis]|uniref:hypothetical protein n=1 Tax=Variovorax guangxiensis TaxID=1775474 RepID=UPI002855B58A|nr:hypothetical protein [Variovorax guangxiensis]MDR6855344.1 hypothetical protein [Variovorax guangxiensis]